MGIEAAIEWTYHPRQKQNFDMYELPFAIL